MKLSHLFYIGIGAGLMYLLDPHTGSQRRATLMNNVNRLANQAGQGSGRNEGYVADKTAEGWAANKERLGVTMVSDEVLGARIRANLRKAVSHPQAINVQVIEGDVILTGDILAREVQALSDYVRSTEGVRSIDNRMNVYESAEGVPSLKIDYPY
ncbi:MAG: BON domain-containing protein [Anaerolineae bacterium]|nr:BON domain-containing protein [Anaerolineae bacterium]